MGHLVHRQFLLALAIVGQDAAHAGVQVPQVQQGHAVLAEQTGDIVASVRGDQGVVGVAADIAELADLRVIDIAHIDDPGLAGIPQTEHETLARSIHQPDHLGQFAVIAPARRDVNLQLQGFGIKDAHAARGVIGNRNPAAILGDGATNTVTGLHHPLDQTPGQQIHLAEAAIASEYIGITFITRIDDRGMGQIAEPAHLAEQAVVGGFEDLHSAIGALDDETEIAGTAQFAHVQTGAATQRQNKQQEKKPQPVHRTPSRRRCASQRASSSLTMPRQGGMALPGRPSRMVVAR